MTVISVIGMHRSGTSLVSRVVNLLGVGLGPDDDLIPAAPDNERGFWENAAIKEINDGILRAFGGSWEQPPPLPPGWEHDDRLEQLRRDGATAIRNLGSGTVGWKDPRTSLTLPFWRTVTTVDHVILVVRDPLHVAQSLAGRNGFGPEKGAALWLHYTLQALRSAPKHHLVSYDDLLARPREVAARLAQALGLPDPQPETLEAITAFSAKDLSHGRTQTGDGGPNERLARTVHDLLVERDVAVLLPLLEPLSQALVTELERARLEHRAGVLAERIEALRPKAAALNPTRERVEYLNARLQRYRVDLQELEAERDDYRRVANRALKQKDDLAERLAVFERAMRTERERRDAERAERVDAVARAEQLQADLRAREADLRKRAAQLDEQKARQRAEHEAHERERQELMRQYARLRGRRGVRMALWAATTTKPAFRAVRRLRGPRTRPAPSVASSPSESSEKAPPAATPAAPPSTPKAADGPRNWAATVSLLAARPAACVLIPIFNAGDAVERCVDSVIRHTTDADILLIDDASTEERVLSLLERLDTLDGVEVLRNRENLGFVRTVNRGLAHTTGDVVLLNSDTVVGPGWLQNLARAAYSDARVASATALTDNGGAFSVPEKGVENRLPAGLGAEQAARLVAQVSARRYPETPTGNAFCMFVKRSALDTVGFFDAERFPRGYGEENDWSMRARKAGWTHVVDDATLVLHSRGASFGSEREALMAQGRSAVDRAHPEYTPLVRAFGRSSQMAEVRRAVAEAFDAVASGTQAAHVAPRVLFVIHAGMGGTPQTNADLMRALAPGHDTLVLYSDTRTVEFGRFTAGGWTPLDVCRLDVPLQFGETTRPQYREFVSRNIAEHGIELVHVRHLVKHTFDVPEVAAILGVPVVVSFHDYYLVCPTVHLLDESDRFCGGICTPGQGSCRIPSKWMQGAPHLKHGWVKVWQARVDAMLAQADAFVTTSPTARDVYQRVYPRLRDQPFAVIEHGRDLVQTSGNGADPLPGGPVRILVPGNLDVHKGADLIAAIEREDTAGRLEFHFMGEVGEAYARLGTNHGVYERHEFRDRVRAIEPAFIGLFSIWAETYAHTLTEAWAAGVPVLATDIGALGERVRSHGGGELLPHDDPQEAYRRILAVADDTERYAELRAQASVEGLPSTTDMADAYGALYDRVRRRRQRVTSGDRHPTLRGRPLETGVFVSGRANQHPGSGFIRTVLPLWHPAVRGDVAPVRRGAAAFIDDPSPPPDVVLVQRTAVPPELVEPFLERCDGSRLVVDLDDNLLDLSDRPDLVAEYAAASRALRHLVQAANLVTVSTPALAAAIAPQTAGGRVEVVANQLDDLLWFGDLDAAASPGPGKGAPVAGLRLLYMGTFTHGQDLAILRPVMERLARTGVRATLTVIGGEREGSDQQWYERVVPPRSAARYPGFVRWLRSQARCWDAALAPLADTPFNAYKSDIKFLDYAALGLPGVYSDAAPYRATIDPGVHGLLAAWDVEEWTEQIRRLATDRELRRHIAREARTMVRTKRTVAANAQRYVEVLYSALETPARLDEAVL